MKAYQKFLLEQRKRVYKQKDNNSGLYNIMGVLGISLETQSALVVGGDAVTRRMEELVKQAGISKKINNNWTTAVQITNGGVI